MSPFNEQVKLESRVAEVTADILKVDSAALHADTDLVADMKVDSLDALEIAIRLQDTFEIDLEELEFARFTTFGQIVAVVQQALAGKLAENSHAAAVVEG